MGEKRYRIQPPQSTPSAIIRRIARCCAQLVLVSLKVLTACAARFDGNCIEGLPKVRNPSNPPSQSTGASMTLRWELALLPGSSVALDQLRELDPTTLLIPKAVSPLEGNQIQSMSRRAV
ncbi:hypothetical protein PGTUg99_015495 [Puccinia graminis f. sp. tritici]|uniref:Uncharacterized protein n=1 Tax=Puccinia graminis f. sp. tritici TaxID=56615 RepID=A0A5B0SIM8_PUCGR|nr:hypothetical protein PGTUg99_015495 [Puccinia graminis f. sp. tritici]